MRMTPDLNIRGVDGKKNKIIIAVAINIFINEFG